MKNILLRCLLLLPLVLPLAAAPNIVMLFADDMGYGDLASYGHPTIRTPNLDRLAEQGIRLTSFYTAPWCVPARIQLMTGRYSGRIKLGGTGSGGSGSIPESETTIAQTLKAAGYQTAMVGKWHLGYQQPEYLPVGKGFDSWFGIPYSNDMRPPWVRTDVPLSLYQGTEPVEHPIDQDTLTTRYTERAEQFIKKASGDSRPFFLYLAYAMPHLPVHTAKRFQGTSRAGLYGDVIQGIDWSAGRVMAALDEAGVSDETIVVFTSDNGPWLNLPVRMRQEGNMPWHAGSPGPLRGSKATTYEGGVRVPGIIRWPGVVEPGRVSAELISTMDVNATFIQAAGAKQPSLPLDGLDLTAFLSGTSEKSPRETFYYFYGERRLDGVRKGPWKLLVKEGIELFHLDLDPSERFNRADEKPQIVAELSSMIAAMKREVGLAD